MTYGSLFSGIGGLDLGLDRAGWECRFQIEIDEYCRRVLEKHWPGVKRYGDITAVRGEELEPVDLIAGGFPCQGRTKGTYRDLTVDVNQWRTPNTRDHHPGGPRLETPQRQISLCDQSAIWQTPGTDSFRSRSGDRKDEMGLDQQARMFWTTPVQGNACGTNKARIGGASLATDADNFQSSLPVPQTPDGPPSSESARTSPRRLNPRFVEWLMGFPVTWTGL